MDDLRDLLERGVEGFEPSADALERTLRRVRRRQLRRRAATVAVALGIATGALGGLWAAFLREAPTTVPADLPEPPPTTAPAEVAQPSPEAPGACPEPALVATAVPEGFSPEPTPGPVSEDFPETGAGIVHYSDPPGRTIEIHRMPAGERSPFPLVEGRPIGVLGREGRIGPIHEGFAVEFTYGEDPCSSYAILAYGVSRADLRAFARGLRPA